MPIGKDTVYAAQLLRAGKLVAVPTETVYGLAGNALDPVSVTEIFRVKNRPFFDPLIVHIADISQAYDYVNDFPDELRKLAERFWPGPLTLLLSKKKVIPDLVTSGSDLVALRVPAHRLALDLLAQLDFPLAAPSANPFGYISPVTAKHVDKQLGREIAYILDGGPCKVGLESTIVGLVDGKIHIYRQGGIPYETLKECITIPIADAKSSSKGILPGSIASHYAPRKPLFTGTLPELLTLAPHDYALLRFTPGEQPQNCITMRVLTASNNLAEAARNLFSYMRELDESPAQMILAESVPETGLGRAINDRLRRAAGA